MEPWKHCYVHRVYAVVYYKEDRMKYILITGANKGIGFATVNSILERDSHTHVFLGSRNRENGERGKQELSTRTPSVEKRITVVPLDVTDSNSIQQATLQVQQEMNNSTLYGIVNNAGIANSSLQRILDVNVYGIYRTCSAFIPLLSNSEGRIVNVTSAAGPSYVATCNTEYQHLLTKKDIDWSEITAFMEQCVGISAGANDFYQRGLGSGSAYGISKACANALTLHLAHTYPHLAINACTPGFIETDMTRPMAVRSNKTPKEMGMKSPSQGTVSIMHLLFSELSGNGWYYGSDAVRSPLDKYRSPGDPPFTE